MLTLDHPVFPRERPFQETVAGRRIIGMLEKARPEWLSLCSKVARYQDRYRAIAHRSIATEPATPHWINDMLPGLDAMFLYTLIADWRPRTYIEVGSGNSTKFVRRAITDHLTSTRIVSIDPCPRAEVDAICDEMIRAPLEEVDDLTRFSGLMPGDIIFIDNSHRSFQNSDVTVFFTEIMPMLPPGVLYGIHDIFLPFDYPDAWADRYYNEQYLLTTYLLGGASGDRIVFPGAYVSRDAEAQRVLKWIHTDPWYAELEKHANGFWLKR